MKYPLIYNEREEAEKIYNIGFSKGFSRHEAVLAAKYLRHIFGYGDARVKTELEKYCQKYDMTGCNLVRMGRLIKSIVSQSKSPFKDNTAGVSITVSEMETLNSVLDYRSRRIMFVLLVLAKFYGGLMYLSNWKHIRETMPSRMSNKQIYKYIKGFCDTGLLEVHGSYHKVLFVDNASPAVILINAANIYSLGKTFIEFFGRDMMTCESCGNSCERKAHNQKRCSECSKKKEQQNRKKWNKDYYSKRVAL